MSGPITDNGVFQSFNLFFVKWYVLKEDGWRGWGVAPLNLFEGSNWVLVNEAFTGAMGVIAPATFAT